MTRTATLIEAAEAQVCPDQLATWCAAMVDITSPPGQERALAQFLADELDRAGLAGTIQPVEGELTNAHGRLPAGGQATGNRDDVRPVPSLLLYAPIDTVTTGDPADDVPWVGPALRPDMQPHAKIDDGLVVGLGAHNPKGHGACVLAAAAAIAKAIDARSADGLGLAGDLLVGFGGGGMPTNARRPDLVDAHGRGCAALVDTLNPDAAVIAKSGWAVSWTEVGLTWFEVEVAGTHTYVGSRHLLPYRNAIADAAHLVAGLERWFERWADETGDELARPQGVVAAIDGGWPHMPAFTPAACRFWVDLRLAPSTTPAAAAEAFGAEVDRLAAEVGATVSWRQTVAIPGTATPIDAPIVQAAIEAWESLTARDHAPISGLSGATDANILRAAGIPTARVGLPKVSRPDLDVDFAFGMNAVEIDDLVRLTRLLIRTAILHGGVN